MEQQLDPAAERSSELAAADADCVQRTLAGDARAFEELIDRYQRRILGTVFRLLGNSHDAADVCQEVFLRAFRSLSSLSEPPRFAAWLTRIACNLALNFRRGRRSGISLAADEDGDSADSAPISDQLVESTHDSMVSEEARVAIDRAIAGLPEKQRLSLVLFAIEGLPHKEVADILECSVEAVKWNVFQARKKLKDELAEYLTE